MHKKIARLALCALLFAHSFPAQAQQPKKVLRIGYLSPFDSAIESARAEAVRLALRERGYIEGQNIAIEFRYGEGKRDGLPSLAAELVRLKVDIIVAAGGTATVRTAKNATKTIPIVMVGAGIDPVEAGLIDSLAHPGGNVTGVTNLATDLGGKRLELLKEAVPKLARVAVLYDPAAPGSVVEVKEVLPVAARALKLTIRFRQFYLVENISYSVSAFSGSADGVENPSDGFWLCSREFSRATNAHTRTRHKLGLKVSKNTGKYPLAFNQILLSEPTIQPWEIRAADDFERVFAALNKQRPDGLSVSAGPLMDTNQKRTIDFALKSRLPSVYRTREAVEAGGLMYYGADLADSYKRVAYYVDRILKGAKPADLPVEQPTKFEFVINLKTAKKIGLTIPPEVLARASRLIK